MIQEPIPSPTDVTSDSALAIGRTAKTIREQTPENPDWLVPGMIAIGATTEVNGREKAGKGYFEMYLIGALERGDPTILGSSSLGESVRAVIYTEEPSQSLKEKFDLFNVSDAFVIYHWELAGNTWLEAVQYLVDKATETGSRLIFIDNISAATRTEDENGVELARKVEPLAARAKEFELAVLYDRHQRKAEGKVKDRARGGTALAGAVDVIVAMEEAAGNERRLTSWGRLWATNWTWQIELSENHDDYSLLDGDYRERILFEREQWTAKEFADVTKVSKETAMTYLKNSPNVRQAGKGPGGSYVFAVEKSIGAPSLA